MPKDFKNHTNELVAAEKYPRISRIIPMNWLLLVLVLVLLLLVMVSSSEAVLDCRALVDSDQGSNQTCHCPDLYRPADEAAWYSGNWSGGCVPEGDPCTVHNVWPPFQEIGNYRPAGAIFQGKVSSMDICLNLCEDNCSCRAAGLQTRFDGSILCYLWFGNNIHISDSSSPGFILYLRRLIPWRRSSLRTKLTITAAAGSAAAVVAVLVTYALRKRARAKESGLGTDFLRVFSYRDLRAATANFSRQIGSGGFGAVFQGRLRDGSMVAIKKLRSPARGDKEFRAEVRTVGVIRHVNLVRLLGFCCEGENRLLVYELLPNGSLASALFGSVGADGGPPCLDWNTRLGIAVGAARGISYLHEGCRDCIIHCDIKPDNVLLDSDFQPKIADFGLAKLLNRDYSKVLTTMCGTVGYVAPEWLSGDPITAKTDVYSFGVTLLELLSGKRNVRRSADSEAMMYPIRRAMEISRGNFMAALDPTVRETADPEEVRRAAVAGLWCIQDEPRLRPSMKEILLLLLQGSSEMGVPPVPTSLLRLVSETPCQARVLQWQPQSDDEDGDDGDAATARASAEEETGMESV